MAGCGNRDARAVGPEVAATDRRADATFGASIARAIGRNGAAGGRTLGAQNAGGAEFFRRPRVVLLRSRRPRRSRDRAQPRPADPDFARLARLPGRRRRYSRLADRPQGRREGAGQNVPGAQPSVDRGRGQTDPGRVHCAGACRPGGDRNDRKLHRERHCHDGRAGTSSGTELKASAIIVAAGSGVRLGSSVPKAFVKVGGRTMLSYSLVTVRQVSSIDEVVITVPAGFENAARAEVASAALVVPVKITPGGVERQDSVRIALALTSAESELVIVHDAARPLATPANFEACLSAAARTGGALAAIPVADTWKRGADGAISATVVRAGLWQSQTPQAFRRDLLLAAHQRAVSEKIVATDDADLVERTGARVEVVEASTENIKITTRSDLAIVEALITARTAK